MAAGRVGSDNLMELMLLLGGISEDDCNLLMEVYNTTDPTKIIDAVFESMASSNFDTISDLIWHIRQNPCFGVKRSKSLREKWEINDSGCLARSKSSNTINKHANSLPVLKPQRPSASAYNPFRNLEWGATGLAGTGDREGATAALTTASSPVFATTTSKPMANNNIKPLMTPEIKPNLSNPITPPPLFSFPAFQPRTATQSSVNSQQSFNPVVPKSNVHFPVVSSPKPAANNPQISWTETPTTTPTSPGMISDWVPDIKTGNGNGKTKKSGNVTGVGLFTSTEFVDPAHAAFEKLCKLFPTASRDEIERLFNLYEGDLELCGSVLIEQGVELNELIDLGGNEPSVSSSIGSPPRLCPSDSPEENPRIPEWEEPVAPLLNTMMVDSRNTAEVYENKVDPIRSQGHFEEMPTSSSSSGGGDVAAMEEETDYFDMILPAEFGKSLLTAFGHPDDESRVLSKDELTIKVSLDTAFELYKGLYLNMHKAESEGARGGSEETTPSSPRATPSDDDEFNEIAISISQMELETSSGDPKLSSIIDIESKLSLQTRKSLKKYTALNRTMAQNVNFCLLKQRYPHIDVAVIDEIYCQYQLDMRKTGAFLDEMYGQSLQSSVQPSTSGEPPIQGTQWHLKYNPKDVKLYSTEQLKCMNKNYEDMEREWLAEMDKIKDCYQKCRTLSNPQVKAYYVSEAKKLSDSMKKLSEEMQYYKAVTQNANYKNDQILDLHGLKLDGAMRVLKEFLQFNEEEFLSSGVPKMILLIIPGQGKHSKNGVPVLQPAVRNFLEQKSYKYHSAKPGTYTVILTRGSVARKM